MRKVKTAKSKVLEEGYIKIYSVLSPKEKRQIFFNREYKKLNPSWDNTHIVLCSLFDRAVSDLSHPLKVLDAGCGNGNYVIDEYRDKISRAFGVDINPEFTGKNICLDEIKYGNLEKIPYENGIFDVVISMWVIEHLERPEKVFLEVSRVLKKGGYLILATPNKDYFLLRLKEVLKNQKLNFFVNKFLYDRGESDVFTTFYKANEIKVLKELLYKTSFSDIELKLNYDPGYTSFNKPSFFLSNLFDRLLNGLKPEFIKAHIVGMARKKS